MTKKLIRDIFSSEVSDLQCDRVQVLFDTIMANQMEDNESQRLYPAVWQHFTVCVDCHAEFLLLLEATEQVNSGSLVRPIHIPAAPKFVPETSTPSTKRNFGLFQLPMATATTRSTQTDSISAEINYPDHHLTLEIDIMAHPEQPQQHMMLITLFQTKESQAMLTDIVFTLHEEESDRVVQSQLINELGDAAFLNIQSGNYVLRWQMASINFVVESVIIPE